jgi:hypothetical protein
MTATTSLEPSIGLQLSKEKEEYKDFQVKFPQPFGVLPEGIKDRIIIVATIEITQHDVEELYVVNTMNINKDGFTARVGKVFNTSDTWDELQLSYTAKRVMLY